MEVTKVAQRRRRSCSILVLVFPSLLGWNTVHSHPTPGGTRFTRSRASRRFSGGTRFTRTRHQEEHGSLAPGLPVASRVEHGSLAPDTGRNTVHSLPGFPSLLGWNTVHSHPTQGGTRFTRSLACGTGWGGERRERYKHY